MMQNLNCRKVFSVYFILFPKDPLCGAVFTDDEDVTFAHKIMKMSSKQL